MGYTHYYKDLVPTREMANAVQGIVSAARSQGISVQGPDGFANPVIKPNLIAINGNRMDGLWYEPFIISTNTEKHGEWFCKTSRKPYDAVVVAILTWAIINESPGWVNIASDGSFQDWIDPDPDSNFIGGIGLYELVFGPLSDDERVKIQARLG